MPEVRVNGPGMTDEAVKAKTGRTWPQWVKVLNAAGAKDLSHRDIAKMVAIKFKLNGWWAQTVTVGYERLPGRRTLHQTTDGFSANLSKTFAVSTTTLFKLFDGDTTRRKLFGRAVTFSTRTTNKTLRFAWPGGGRVVITFYPKAARKTQVTFQHGKLATAKDVVVMKAFWTGVIAKAQELSAN